MRRPAGSVTGLVRGRLAWRRRRWAYRAAHRWVRLNRGGVNIVAAWGLGGAWDIRLQNRGRRLHT